MCGQLVLDRRDDDTNPALKTQALLTLGAMARRVRPANHILAKQIVANLHHLLEQHTGIYTPLGHCLCDNFCLNLFLLLGYTMPTELHKYKRSISLSSSLPRSSLHALIIDSLANAGAVESYVTLQHHMTIGGLSVKHAAIRAMNSYDTDEVK